jgi:hypothetical protein
MLSMTRTCDDVAKRKSGLRGVHLLRREANKLVAIWGFGVRHVAALCGVEASDLGPMIYDRLQGATWAGPDPRIIPSIDAWAVKLRRRELEVAGFGPDIESTLRVLGYLERLERQAIGTETPWTPELHEMARPEPAPVTEVEPELPPPPRMTAVDRAAERVRAQPAPRAYLEIGSSARE